MAKDSPISWTDHTQNYWIGCSKVSDGCANCYAERDFSKYTRWADCWGASSVRRRTSASNWGKPFTWNKQALKAGRRAKVFCQSLSDLFEDHEQVGQWRDHAFRTMESTVMGLDWLVLTKRIENVERMVPQAWKSPGRWPPNVWLGFSASTQSTFDQRAAVAMGLRRKYDIPVVFASLGPLLETIDVRKYLRWGFDDNLELLPMLDWIIAEGESGPDARIMPLRAIRRVREACVTASIPFHFKQWGEWLPQSQITQPLNDWIMSRGHHVPVHDASLSERYYRVGTKRAGNVLDNHVYLAMPEPPPMMQCPKCKQWLKDFDGMGVLAHLECGYCSHPSASGNICEVCGQDINEG